MHFRRSITASLVLAAAFSFAACGSDDAGSDSSSASTPAAGGVVVTGLDGIKWDKSEYSATAGDVSITLRNQSSLPHTLAVVAEDGTKIGTELKTTSSGDEQTGTFPLTAGTYSVICTVPGHGAMKAALIVS